MDPRPALVAIFNRPEITIKGDSHVYLISRGESPFNRKLETAYGEKYRLLYHSFPGKNISEICGIVPQTLEPKRDIAVVILVGGTNSACHDHRQESDDVIRKELRDTLEKISEEYRNTFVILTTPPPIRDEFEYKVFMEDGHEVRKIWREQKRITEIAGVIREFEGPRVRICDLHKALSESGGEWHIDGAHLNHGAEVVLADLMVQTMQAGGIL